MREYMFGTNATVAILLRRRLLVACKDERTAVRRYIILWTMSLITHYERYGPKVI